MLLIQFPSFQLSLCEMLIIYLFLDKYLRSRITRPKGLNKAFETFTALPSQQNVPIYMLASPVHVTHCLCPNIGHCHFSSD